MKIVNFASYLLLSLLITGCTNTEKVVTAKPTNEIYLDQAFVSDHKIETEEQIFYVSKPMRRYIDQRLKTRSDTVTHKTSRLISDLFDPNYLDIHYAHDANLTAAETFEQGVANCLSLTLLSYVLVQEADLEAAFVDVTLTENWTVENGISLANGHVNLLVYRVEKDNELRFSQRIVTIDFLPMLNVPVIKQRILDKKEIMSLFYNNKGANALIEGDTGKAYQYFKQATLLGPQMSSNWGNLASLYRQAGFLQQAEQLFDYALYIDPDNLTIKENLAMLYRRTDRVELAEALEKRVRKERSNNPYYYAMLAALDYDKGQYRQAIRHYRKAISMHNKEHQFLFGLAKSYTMLNDYPRAKRYLLKAQAVAASHNDKQLYHSKLSALESMMAKNH